MSIDKLEKLSPEDKTIDKAVKVERMAFERLTSMIDDVDLDNQAVNSIVKILNAVGKMRVNQRCEITVKTSIFKSVTKDPDELKLYVEASFPGVLKQ